MSKERELLQRVIAGDDDGDFFISHRLYKDIETFLAQPEQEPVENRIARWHTLGYEQGKKASKREPLIYEHLEALVDKYHGYPMTLGRAIEKEHGIGAD